jgi:hypothetical protein
MTLTLLWSLNIIRPRGQVLSLRRHLFFPIYPVVLSIMLAHQAWTKSIR